MSTITAPRTAFVPRRRHRPLAELQRPADAFAHIGPNWFASVMGTGILATAVTLLPVRLPCQATFALAAWLLAATLLVALAAVTAVHWIRHPGVARTHHRNPAMAPFYGAPPMAMLTVGAGALLVGPTLVGSGPAVAIDEVLWPLGTVSGLICTVAIPYFMVTGPDLTLEQVNGSWLMAIVPPMVSAATGAGLIAHLPAGQDQLALALACYAMFGISLLASVIVLGLVIARLGRHGAGEARLVPTMWIGLGPLGQSITAVGLLSAAAAPAIGAVHSSDLRDLVLVYGIPVWGFALVWLALAAAITIHTARRRLPFALTWWSFTFPLGTMVTGTSQLSDLLGAQFLTVSAVALFGLLVAGWLTVAARTAGGIWSGALLKAPVIAPLPAAS
jgi:C4-dicarboxylate transporter/malic acid transport protein